ncbi:MAG: response regulator [Anaerolineales bacterium]|nr:MAG: response regulator [Anaerolineales bacterium]
MLTVLYAEDDRDCRELFAFVLRQQGYRVYEALNGAQAVQIVRDEPIDLVILDVRMPMMTGYDAARMISQEAPHIPVMFLSAKGLQREVQKAFDCAQAVVDYLVKPVSPAQLVRRVDQVLQVARTQGLEAVRRESLSREELALVQR